MSIIHPRDVRTLVLTRSTEGFSAPLASLYSVISAGPYVIRLLYELRTPDYYPWVGFPTSEVYCFRPRYYFNIMCRPNLRSWSKIPDSNRPFQFGRLTCQPLTLILHKRKTPVTASYRKSRRGEISLISYKTIITKFFIKVNWCGRPGSNRHEGQPHGILSPRRLPIPPLPHMQVFLENTFFLFLTYIL